MKGTLTKIKSNHNNLRTESVTGEFDLPEVGFPFVMFAPPLESGDVRMIHTTPVVSLYREGNTCSFDTENSTYSLTVTDDVE